MENLQFSRDDYLEMLSLFLRKDVVINYGKEIRTAKILLNKYPDLSFWRGIKLGFKLRSLLWFLGKGKKQLDEEYSLFTPLKAEKEFLHERYNEIKKFEEKSKNSNLLVNENI